MTQTKTTTLVDTTPAGIYELCDAKLLLARSTSLSSISSRMATIASSPCSGSLTPFATRSTRRKRCLKHRCRSGESAVKKSP